MTEAMLPETLRGEMDWLGCLTSEQQETLIELLGRVQAHLHEREDQNGEAS